MRFAGVDGCRAGWLLAWLGDDRLLGCMVLPDFAALADATADAVLTLVDIPIGLRGTSDRTERLCESAGRALLKARASSLFPVPVRPAVHAATYAEACEQNSAATGRKLSRQTWGIAPKIAQADRVMAARPALQARLRESHPELCFSALNGWRPMAHNKKRPEGESERLRLLSGFVENAPEALANARSQYRRTAVATDDILDAMVLAVAAREARTGGLSTLPPLPEVDAAGLRMELVLPRIPPGS